MRAGRVAAMIVGVVASFIASNLRADLPPRPIRALTIDAEIIVAAEPIDRQDDTIARHYRVTEVLHGPMDLAGTTVRILEHREYRRRLPTLPESTTPLEPLGRTLLFLRHPREKLLSDQYEFVRAGLRATNAQETILAPTQPGDLRFYLLTPEKGATWEGVLTRVREDLPRIAEIRALGTIPDRTRRNEAIFQWIAQHRSELAMDPRGEGIGWGALQEQLFEWVLESGQAEACWKTLELATEVGGWPQRSAEVFCTPEGRTLLLDRVFDPSRSDRLRKLALRSLAERGTSWGGDRPDLPDRRILTREEQERIIDKIVPLLGHADPHWRRDAVVCLSRVSQPGISSLAELASHRATPALTERFRTERDPQVRRELVETLRAIEDDPFWERLTGNPEGIAVLLALRGTPDETIELVAHLLPTKAKISEVPSLRLERLTDEGAVAETRTRTLSFASSTKGRSGWESRIVALKTPRGDLPAGRWRATLQGRSGERRWSSDPIEITLPERPAEGGDR